MRSVAAFRQVSDHVAAVPTRASWKKTLQIHADIMLLSLGLWVGASLFYGVSVALPWLLMALCGAVLGLLGVWTAERVGKWARPASWVLLAMAVGMALGAWQVQRASDRLDWRALQRPVWVQGRVTAQVPVKQVASGRPPRVWMVVAPAKVYVPGGVRTVAEVRASVDARRAVPVGEGVAAQVQVWLPQGPRLPGQRDTRLWRFLDTDHLRGYVRGELAASALPAGFGQESQTGWAAPWQALRDWLAGLRGQISQALAGQGQGVVAALLVGDEQFIPKEVVTAYRNSGLAHLLAISGFQLTVVGGGLFLLLRGGMALWPWLALRVDTRLWAALLAWPVTVFYTLLVGAEVSMVRASLMMSVLFLAMAVGRTRSLLRSWAMAVLVLVVLDPSVVMRAGFTLSFVAVLGLILWAESLREQGPARGLAGKLGRALGNTTIVSVVAAMATLPVVALFFGQVNLLGVLANTLAVPAMAVLTWLGMGVLGLWPLGADNVLAVGAADLMGWGVTRVNEWARLMADLPGATLAVPTASGWLLVPLCGAVLVAIYNRAQTWAVAGGLLLVAVVLWLHPLALVPQQVVSRDAREPAPYPEARVVRRTEMPDAEDCRLAEVLRVEARTPVPPACAAKVLRDDTFMWAAREAQGPWRGRWVVQAPVCVRPWQVVSEECITGY